MSKSIGIRRLLSLLSLSLCLTTGPTFAADNIKRIVIASESWETGTNPDGTGSFFDMIREVYALDEIEMEYRIVPYERSIDLTRKQEVDAWVASYFEEEDFALFPKWHFDADLVTAVFKRNRFPTFKDAKSLEGLTVGWIRGYDYDEYIDTPMKIHVVNNRASAFRMLARNRLDVFIDASVDIDIALQDEENVVDWEFNRSEYAFQEILQLKLYLAFSDTDRSRQLIKIWDRNFERLLKSGRIKAIYEKYNRPTYPF